MPMTAAMDGVVLALLLVLTGPVCAATAAALEPECRAYLAGKGLESPHELKAQLEICTPNEAHQAEFAPNPEPAIPGATDTTPLSCRYGHPSLLGETGGTCCGWKPHFNWVVATCDPSGEQEQSHFCKGLPECVHKDGEAGCGAKINYVAAYQYNGKEFVLLDESTAGDLSAEGVAGSFAEGTGWEQLKKDFAWKGGDWTSKYAPWGDGQDGPRGVTPPGMLWVLSADSFYYGAFYMLSQLTLNLEGKGYPTGTNCWNWEFDPVEGSVGWMPEGAPLPGNLNQLYSTNNAAVSGCMPVTYMASQANGNRREFSQPATFKQFCKENPTAAGCQPWVEDVMWSGGVDGTQRFENYANQPYVWAVVVDHKGYWIYRWIPDAATGETGWPGIERNRAARVLPKRPRAVTDPRGLATNVRGDVAEAVILQPSVPPDAACLRASVEPANFQFGADALGAMAAQLDEYGPGGGLEGAQNWWAHFHDTEQYQGYPLSIAGLPTDSLPDLYTCNSAEGFTCDCKVQAEPLLRQEAVPPERSAPAELVKGISYGPMPCRGPCTPQQDDFMAEEAKHLWGPKGRGDLRIMRQLGANHVRTYGNNPANDHRSFLDEALSQGLHVSVGISDYPYIQRAENCVQTNSNCYAQVNESYSMSLRTGFLTKFKAYHPAIKEVIVVNEPDLKLGAEPVQFSRGIISAIDAMLDAEKEAGVRGPLPNFTVTFSYAICMRCTYSPAVPALAQMLHLREALMDPRKYGYEPKNDLASFFHTRFSNSFNTANPASDIKVQFLDHYERAFDATPVTIQEYHRPVGEPLADLVEILEVARGSSLLRGVSFFEFQVRYDKGGAELDFGVFGLGDYGVARFDYFGEAFTSWCLVPRTQGTQLVSDAVASAYGGPGVDYAELCVPDPRTVPLTAEGFLKIAAQRNETRMTTYVARVASQLGGSIEDDQGLRAFSRAFAAADTAQAFGDLVAKLQHRPSWAGWSPEVACVADRLASAGEVGQAIGWACGNMTSFNCSRDIPDSCSKDVWSIADYVFGAYYQLMGGPAGVGLDRCYFGGAATLAPPSRLQAQRGPFVWSSSGSACSAGSPLWSGQDSACGARCRDTPQCEHFTTYASGLCQLVAAGGCEKEVPAEDQSAVTYSREAGVSGSVEQRCSLSASRWQAGRSLRGLRPRGGSGS